MRRVFLACIGVLLVSASASAATAAEDAVRDAIIRAVQEKLRTPAEIRVEGLQARGDLDRPLVAQVAPGSRTGVRVRFVLVSAGPDGSRVGEADAVVFAAAPHVRAARQLHRGAAIADDATLFVDGDLGSIPIQPLPQREAITGAIAAREIARGEVVTAAMVNAPPVIKAGDKVIARAISGKVYVQAVVVAAQPGAVGDVIRCVNPDTRKAMAARIIGPGVAEVIHAF